MTLEKGKSYGQEQIQQTLQDKARTRLNNPAPHQAPQRERVSRATIPIGRTGGQPPTRTRRWKALIRPEVNMGVPQLMMILEPNIVWEHTIGFVSGVGKEVEANVTPGEFFDGWHKGGRRAHGVYEGSYWDLMGDCDELAEMLRKLSKAPALLEEPPLELPPPPELPAWDDFKPNLHLIPPPPSMPVLKLPPFRAPILEPEPPFVEPEYLPLPPVPNVPKEEPLPIFIPPEFLQVEPLVEPEYVDPPPPLMPDVPPTPSYGQPKHGHDWSGLRPFQLDPPTRDTFMAEAASRRVMDTSRFMHPPNNLPQVPELEPLDEDLLKGLDLEPIPRLELAWMGGPEPDPPYASVPSSPAALSRSTSRAPSRPMSAAPSRPMSAAPSRPMSAAPSRPMSSAVHPSISVFEFATNNAVEATVAATSTPARQRISSAASQRKSNHDGSAQPWSAGPEPMLPTNSDCEAATATPPAIMPSPRMRSSRRGSSTVMRTLPQAVVKTPEEQAWEDARSVGSEASGTPRVWMNFSAPFADLPPIMMPPRPEPGPEPLPEDFPHDTLEDLPVFSPPALLDAPVYVEPPQFVPQWAPPCEPRPVGFLRGTAPIIICDVSGTMNPRQQGRFRDLKRCAVDLLDPEGEIATAAAGFDVITFAGAAWSWSAGYTERMGLLQSSQVPYSGRQVGGRYSSKTPPGGGGAAVGSRCGSPERFRGGGGLNGGNASSVGSGLTLMPTQADLLSDAQRWVANWPDAVGQTSLSVAFALAEQHANADCWYILSDGMAQDQQACLEYLAKRNEAGTLPVIHAVGFIPADANPDSSGERFLRGIAELTGGSYQRYTPEIHKVWVSGQGFVRVDLRNETPEQREERQWAEKHLRAERIKNLRLGISEPLEVTMERVGVLHQQLRVAPAVRANEAAVGEARRRHGVAMESVRLTNERRMAEAMAMYEAAVVAVRARNQAKVDAAREAFLQSHGDWERDYLERLQDWEDAKATLETQREEQLAAARTTAEAAAATAVAPSPRANSTRPYVSMTGSRPTSAVAYAALPKSKAGVGLVALHYEPSEQRAAFAAADYDAAMGLERVVDKLASAIHTPPSSRPVSAITTTSHGGGGGSGSSRPVSAMKATLSGGGGGGGSSRPVSGGGLGDATTSMTGGASEYLEAITEDLTEASAPLDAVYGGCEDDGLDVRPPGSRSRSGRDQDSASSRRSMPGPAAPTSAPHSSRPVSARAASAGSRGTPAARSPQLSATSSRKASGLGMLPEGSPLPVPPLLPEATAPLQPLRGEKSDEFKRRLYPAEVVEEHDITNMTRLDEIRQCWESLVAADLAANSGRKLAAMRRNAGRIEEYKKAVYEAYANGLVRDMVYGGAVRVAANLALMDNADARYRAEVDRINAENARLREEHAAEVAEKKAKEDAHAQAIRRWEEAKEAAARQHESDKERARTEHDANIVRLKAEWRAKTQQILELNDARLTEAEAMHAALLEQIKENNRRHKEEHTELLRQRKEVEITNTSRLAEAKAVHKVRLESRAADNERLIKTAMEEHQATCVRLQEEYEESKAQADVDHAELCTFLKAANEQLTEEARRRYQEALAEVQAAYEADCTAVREVHARDLERVKRFNQDIWPKVHVARLAQAELARVQLFAEHIRFCANKFELGINLMPNTPNYDRVVEMQALTEALAKAFPDMPPSLLPWPEHERRLDPGTGWVASPAVRSLTYREPIDFINRIAKGKTPRSANSPASGPSRGDSPATLRGPSANLDADAGILTTSGSVDELPHPHQPLQQSNLAHQQQHYPSHPNSAPPYTPRHVSRPLSAGRARFAGVLSGDVQRPLSAMVPAPCSARVEAWGNVVAAAASALSSPGGALRPQSAATACYQNPSAWRRSNTTVLRTGSPRNIEIRRNPSNLGAGAGGTSAGGGGPPSTTGAASTTLSQAVAAAAAATAAMGGMASRPGTARPGTAHSGGAGSGGGATRPRSAGPMPRPPARVAVDVTPLQASVARAKAQAGSHALTAATLAGFSKDVPKLRYPEVDVPQAITVASSLRS